MVRQHGLWSAALNDGLVPSGGGGGGGGEKPCIRRWISLLGHVRRINQDGPMAAEENSNFTRLGPVEFTIPDLKLIRKKTSEKKNHCEFARTSPRTDLREIKRNRPEKKT